MYITWIWYTNIRVDMHEYFGYDGLLVNGARCGIALGDSGGDNAGDRLPMRSVSCTRGSDGTVVQEMTMERNKNQIDS